YTVGDTRKLAARLPRPRAAPGTCSRARERRGIGPGTLALPSNARRTTIREFDDGPFKRALDRFKVVRLRHPNARLIVRYQRRRNDGDPGELGLRYAGQQARRSALGGRHLRGRRSHPPVLKFRW